MYARKIKTNARKVIQKKKDLARRASKGEKVPASEYKKVNSVVAVDRTDLGQILYGDLDKYGLPHPESPIATHFTQEKINEAMRKVSNTVCHFPFLV